MTINIESIKSVLARNNFSDKIGGEINSLVESKLAAIRPLFAKAGEVQNGFVSLNDFVSRLDTVIVSNGLSNIDGVSGFVKSVGAAKSDLDKITGESIEDSVIDVIVTSGTGQAIAQAVEKVTATTPQSILSSLGINVDFSLLQNPKAYIGNLLSSTNIDALLHEITGNFMVDTILAQDTSPISEIIGKTGLTEPQAESFAASVYNEKPAEAISIVNANNANNLSDAEIEEFTKNYEMSVFALTEERSFSDIESSYPVISSPISSNGDFVSSRGDSVSIDSGQFTLINSIEELEADFRTCVRDVTEVVVHWSAHFTNQNIGSDEINRIHRERGFAGIGYHYVIRRDGTIQRGRSINQVGAHAVDNGHNNYSIGVCFVGGYNCPSSTQNPERFVSKDSLTRAQMTAFDQFMEKYYLVWPGGQAWGHVDTDNKGKVDPGFSVPDYVKSKWNKINVSESGKIPPLSPAELAKATFS